ncbi:CcdB family protein [Atlantibacter sp. RC6]|uniref:CcdB family protein n=1 Tax=Atlantibacter sp. RC6 TaxID=2587036 RepID=UPI00351BCE74
MIICLCKKYIITHLTVGSEKFVLMTHELASIPERALGEEVCSIIIQRDVIKSALDFLLDGIS